MTHNNFRTIHSISYFVAAAGLLGEACAESPQDTQIKDVERGKDDQTLNAIHLCVMILTGAMRLGLDKLRSWDIVAPWIAPLAQNSEIVATEDRRAARDNAIEQPQVAMPVRVLTPRPSARRQSVANL